MKQVWQKLFLITFPLATLGSLAPITSVKAQITPDNTLGAESSVVNRNLTIPGINIPSDRIDGGARRGNNLFHSFQKFNVDEGRGVYFSNPAGVDNILTRVTGSNPSNIFGRLGVLGNANLFLINPRGILFGPNASLNVGGSFFASTASSLIFNNGFEFSAVNPQAPPLLTVNIPIGLRFRDNPGSITVNGFGQPQGIDGGPRSPEKPTLAVPAGNTLALIGGNVSLDGGVLLAEGGLVELGGLTAAGTVGINSDNSLSFHDGVERADVSLKNSSNVNVSNVDPSVDSSGSIAVNARNLDLQHSSLTAAINQLSSSPSLRASGITVNATGIITLGQSSQIESTVLSNFTNNGGNINITTGSLSIMNGSQVNTFTSGQGNAGNVTINAGDNLLFDGPGSGILSITLQQSTGNAGNISIHTGTLSLTNSAQVSSRSNGQGKAGSVTINAKDLVSLQNRTSIATSNSTSSIGNNGGISITTGTLSISNNASDNVDVASLNTSTSGIGNAGDVKIVAPNGVSLNNGRILTSTNDGSIGMGGDVSITSGNISLANGSLIILSTGGQGNAGNALLNTRSLSLTGGSQLTASSAANSPGNGGAIQIKATESVSLSGSNPMDGHSTEISTDTTESSTGSGGNITIDTNAFRVSDRAIVNARTTSNRNAGNITINSKTFEATNGGELVSTSSASGNGGNINLQIGDLLLLRGQSLISTSAGSNASGGNGGNITIYAPVIVASPQNNDITANAFSGNGGRVTIRTQAQGLFGIAPLSRTELEQLLNTTDASQLNPNRLPTSDITAISQRSPSLNGTVNINTSYLNPSQNLVELPKNVVDATRQIAQNPCQRGEGSTFAVTGRGGIPSNPNQTIASDNVRVGLVTPVSSRGTATTTAMPSTKLTVKKAVPVQGWVFNEKGQVVLTAYDPTKTGSQRPWRTPASCPQR